MFYLYHFDHIEKHMKVWRLVEPVKGFPTSSEALMDLREIAKWYFDDIENYRLEWFAEPSMVEKFVSSIFYKEPAKIKTK